MNQGRYNIYNYNILFKFDKIKIFYNIYNILFKFDEIKIFYNIYNINNILLKFL